MFMIVMIAFIALLDHGHDCHHVVMMIPMLIMVRILIVILIMNLNRC